MMNPEKYQVNSESMKKLEKLLAPAEAKVIDGNMFKVLIITLIILINTLMIPDYRLASSKTSTKTASL